MSRADTDTPSMLFLEAERVAWTRRAPFVAGALAAHALLFALTFPEASEPSPLAEREWRDPIVIDTHTPPPPKIEAKRIERTTLTERVPIPDPTPRDPEPILEPEPEEVIVDIPPDLQVKIGEPEPPPVTGPLMPGFGGVTNPELIPETQVQPEYPELARRARLGGKVYLQAVIRKDGTVGDIEVLKEPPGNLGFSEKAVAAVSQWRYRPAMQSDRPVDVYFTVMVAFTLE